jgi:hypothetical protein
MRSKKVTLSVPWPLWEALEKHAPKAGYSDPKQLMIWCAFYSCLVGKYHHITAPIAQAPPEVQDAFLDDAIAAIESGDAERGCYLEHVLADVVKRFNLPVGEEVIKAVLADAVRKRPKRRTENK